MTTSPPAPASPGTLYNLYLNFYDEESGSLVNATAVQLDITYGNEVGLVSDVSGGGPFVFAGLTTLSPGAMVTLGTGQYAFQWQVPENAVNGVYVANWTITYGVDNDQFLIVENFPLTGGSVAPVATNPAGVSNDFGYWTGMISYQPTWSQTPFVIPLGATDANGTTWILKSVTGWDSPPSVGSVIQRSSDHGGWPAIQTYGPRIITLDVMASAVNQEMRDVARAALQQAIPIGDLATFTYDEPVPKAAYVRRNGSATVSETCPTLCDVEFTIPLVAPDPRKYSVMQHYESSAYVAATGGIPVSFSVPVTITGTSGSGGQLGIANAGTFETRPSIVINGPIASPVITNATLGMSVSWSNVTLGTGDVLLVDMDARQGYVNNSYTPADPGSAWWVMQPGPSEIQLTGDQSGGSAITVYWYDAWI